MTGPFVARTEGAFETEYLYEREKILQIDYLAADGGEADAAPYLGLRGHNEYLGCESPVWTKGIRKWNMLRFDPDDGDSACDEALYMTEQRNCVFYAAVYVRCAGISAPSSAMKTPAPAAPERPTGFSDTPYGRVKGVPTMGNLVPVTFEDGLNLLLFKLRPGYICDTVDLSMTNCSIYPVAAQSGALCLTYPARTAVFVNRGSQPKQIFPCFAAAFADLADGRVEIGSADGGVQTVALGAMRAGECRLVRAEIDAIAGETPAVPVAVTAAGSARGEGCFPVRPKRAQPLHTGTELAMTSFHFDDLPSGAARLRHGRDLYSERNPQEMRRDGRFKAIIRGGLSAPVLQHLSGRPRIFEAEIYRRPRRVGLLLQPAQ